MDPLSIALTGFLGFGSTPWYVTFWSTTLGKVVTVGSALVVGTTGYKVYEHRQMVEQHHLLVAARKEAEERRKKLRAQLDGKLDEYLAAQRALRKQTRNDNLVITALKHEISEQLKDNGIGIISRPGIAKLAEILIPPKPMKTAKAKS